jgi:hypothetical protein
MPRDEGTRLGSSLAEVGQDSFTSLSLTESSMFRVTTRGGFPVHYDVSCIIILGSVDSRPAWVNARDGETIPGIGDSGAEC